MDDEVYFWFMVNIVFMMLFGEYFVICREVMNFECFVYIGVMLRSNFVRISEDIV